jgi:hypothetical protein
MTELSTNLFLEAGQMLLDEQERAFIAACNTICVITEAKDGWPGLRMLDATSGAIEIVNSRSLRMRIEPALPGSTKIALLMIRHSDGQHLILHGHIAASSGSDEGEPRTRICVASRLWSPELGPHPHPALARALHRS